MTERLDAAYPQMAERLDAPHTRGSTTMAERLDERLDASPMRGSTRARCVAPQRNGERLDALPTRYRWPSGKKKAAALADLPWRFLRPGYAVARYWVPMKRWFGSGSRLPADCLQLRCHEILRRRLGRDMRVLIGPP